MEWLGQQFESVSAASERRSIVGRELSRAGLPRKEQQARLRANLFDLQREVKAVFSRHKHVAKKHIGAKLGRSGERFAPRISNCSFVSSRLNYLGQTVCNRLLIVDNENLYRQYAT